MTEGGEALAFSFGAAVIDRYADDNTAAEECRLFIGERRTQKEVEFVGLEKVRKYFRDFARLQTLDLGAHRVANAEGVEKLEFPRVSMVNLSDSGIRSFGEILRIVARMPKLQSLSLQRCHFDRAQEGQAWGPLEAEMSPAAPALTTLDLTECNVSWPDVVALSFAFPALQRLGCSKCPQLFEEKAAAWLHASDTFSDHPLAALDVSSCSVNSWEQVVQICVRFPHIREINLAFNALSSVDEAPSVELSLQELGLEANKIVSWESVGKLSLVCPQLRALRWSGNPMVFPRLKADHGKQTEGGVDVQLSRFLVIATFPNIVNLNGCAVEADERKHAELYFLSLSARKAPVVTELDPLGEHVSRLATLHQTLREDAAALGEVARQRREDQRRLLKVTIMPAFDSDHLPFTRDLPSWFKVKDVKALCRKSFEVPFSRQRLLLKAVPATQKSAELTAQRFDQSLAIELEDDEQSLDFYDYSHTSQNISAYQIYVQKLSG